MSQYSELKKALQPHLRWHGARVSFLALFLLALLKVKTVNLSELALGFEGLAKPASNYKRLQRFFRFFGVEYTQVAQIVVKWMKIPQPWTLSLDRTTWEFGDHCHNILVLGIVHQGIAIPLVHRILDLKGNSNTQERLELMEEFTQIFPDAEVAALCGDREFIGQVWTFYLLLAPQIPFRLRIRATDKIDHNGVNLAARILLAHLQVGQSQRLQGSCRVWGCAVAVEGLRLPDGKLLVVIAPPDAASILSDYAKRWGIETLFGAFKTRGFCLESTHFTDPERLRKLFTLLTLALCWAMQTGLFLNQLHPIPIKKHGRKAKSLFRLGLDYLRHLVLNPHPLHERDFLQSLDFLSCT